MLMKNSNDTIWNRTSDLLICSTAPYHCATAVPYAKLSLLLNNAPRSYTKYRSALQLWNISMLPCLFKHENGPSSISRPIILFRITSCLAIAVVRMYVCMYVCMCVYVCMYVHVCIPLCMYVCVYMHV